jgi:metal-responsive CopG/Arc/MetJ family transcriptional regulator
MGHTNKHPLIGVHAPKELVEILNERAKQEKTTRSAIIIEALWFYLTNSK